MGIAAWIKELRTVDHFLSCPAVPRAIDLVDLENIQNKQDVNKVADFSNMANFVPVLGEVVDQSKILWREHRDILSDMKFASEPWNQAERLEYSVAMDILYTLDPSGHRSPSSKRIMYNEMKVSYEDIKTSGASEMEIRQAWSDWIALGYKLEIENALQTINKLTSRTSVVQVQEESDSLAEPDGMALYHQVNGQFAPVYFTPISAVARETWMEAEVSFGDLSIATSNSPYKEQWNVYGSTKSGRVSFEYVVLDCIRPWFTQSLYASDDWKLGKDNERVSTGNGKNGAIPAYVNSVYLASIKNVAIVPTTRPPTNNGDRVRGRGRSFPVGHTRVLSTIVQSSRNALGVHRTKVLGTPITSVLKNPSSFRSARQTPTVQTRILATPSLSDRFTIMNRGGQLRRLTASDLDARYHLAQQILRQPNQPRSNVSADSTPAPAYIVGFGCKKIPYAPNPNPNYNW